MLQRIQTLWLLLAAISMGALFFAPFIFATGPAQTVQTLDHLEINAVVRQHFTPIDDLILFRITAIGLIVLMVGIVFLFKQLRVQIILTYTLVFLTLIWCFCLNQTITDRFTVFSIQANNYRWGSILPSLAIGALMLAARAMRKDRSKLDSLNRLR